MPITPTALETYLKSINPLLCQWGHPFKINAPILGYKLSKDVQKHSYWTVDHSSFDSEVQQEFAKGNVILVHAIHDSVALIMSKEQFEKYVTHPQTSFIADYNEWWKVESAIEEEYFARSEKVNASGVLAPGYIYSTGVADGSANYLVTKVTKASVFVDHLHFGDGYSDHHISAFGGKVPRKHFDQISCFGRMPLFARQSPWA